MTANTDTAKRRTTTVDVKSFELAEHFLSDYSKALLDNDEAEKLAAEIQEAIEDYLRDLGERIEANSQFGVGS